MLRTKRNWQLFQQLQKEKEETRKCNEKELAINEKTDDRAKKMNFSSDF